MRQAFRRRTGRDSLRWRGLVSWLLYVLATVLVGCRDDSSPSADRQVAQEAAPRRGKGKGKASREHDPERQRKIFKVAIPTPQRTFYVSVRAVEDGDGSEAKPWRDLKAALCQLQPGDQLMVLPGHYKGPFVIDRPCQDGTPTAPIRVVGLEDSVLNSSEGGSILVIKRPFWTFQRFEIVPGKARNPAVVIEGPDAHDLLLEEFHMHNGWGDGIKIGRDVRRLTIANSHIHNFGHPKHNRDSGGILVEEGVADITIVGNRIHHGMAGPIYMGKRRYGDQRPDGTVEAPPGVTLSQNTVQMTWDGD